MLAGDPEDRRRQRKLRVYEWPSPRFRLLSRFTNPSRPAVTGPRRGCGDGYIKYGYARRLVFMHPPRCLKPACYPGYTTTPVFEATPTAPGPRRGKPVGLQTRATRGNEELCCHPLGGGGGTITAYRSTSQM